MILNWFRRHRTKRVDKNPVFRFLHQVRKEEFCNHHKQSKHRNGKGGRRESQKETGKKAEVEDGDGEQRQAGTMELWPYVFQESSVLSPCWAPWQQAHIMYCPVILWCIHRKLKSQRGEAENFSAAKAEPRTVNARTQVDFLTSKRGAPCSPQQGREGGWANPPRCDISHSAYN